jgi:hypothetical protein
MVSLSGVTTMILLTTTPIQIVFISTITAIESNWSMNIETGFT